MPFPAKETVTATEGAPQEVRCVAHMVTFKGVEETLR